MKADLHIHSRFSDGRMNVEDIVFYAKKIGLDTISLTDHDTMSGVAKAVICGKKLGVNVIPGAETTTRDTKRGRPVHFLCYLPKKPMLLQSFLDVTLKNRAAQKTEMIKKIMKIYPVTMEHILQYSKDSASIYESHIMQALADLGYTNVVVGGELMDKLISSKGSCYVKSTYPDVYTALDKIHEAGAVVVMAHPGEFDSLELLEELAKAHKIEGVEYNHPKNTEHDKAVIFECAKKYGLVMTGGTDFHGQYTRKPYPLGSFTCGEEAVEGLYRLSSLM